MIGLGVAGLLVMMVGGSACANLKQAIVSVGCMVDHYMSVVLYGVCFLISILV